MPRPAHERATHASPLQGGSAIASQPTRPASTENAVALLLRWRRRWILLSVFLIAFVVASSVWSHLQMPADPRDLDGKAFAVVRVIDGDSIVIAAGAWGGRETVRLRGIDAPELGQNGKPPMQFADEARQYLTNRVDGKPVTLKFDPPETRDRYGRLLAFVYVGDTDCMNVDLVRDGMAYVDRRFKSFMQSQLDAAEAQARAKQIGLWKGLTTDQMPAWRQAWLKNRRHEDSE